MTRRTFLNSAGTGLAGILAAGSAPAFAQGAGEVKWRLASSFPKSLDTLFGAADAMAKRVAAATGGTDFLSPALHLHFTESKAAAGTAVLGVRPEQIRIDAEGCFNGTVQHIEPMGGQQIVWLQCGHQVLAAVVHHVAGLALDQVVRFHIDAASVSLFDAASGTSIPQARGVF